LALESLKANSKTGHAIAIERIAWNSACLRISTGLFFVFSPSGGGNDILFNKFVDEFALRIILFH
jgi:hypothetical protein